MAGWPGLPVQRQGLRHATVVVLGPEPSAGSAVAALPEEAVTFFGAGGSLLVGLAYLPSATALRNRGQALSDDLFPLRVTRSTRRACPAAQRPTRQGN